MLRGQRRNRHDMSPTRRRDIGPRAMIFARLSLRSKNRSCSRHSKYRMCGNYRTGRVLFVYSSAFVRNTCQFGLQLYSNQRRQVRGTSLSAAVVKVVLWSRGGGLTWGRQVGANPIPIPRPTNLALFGHKITHYRFNQGAHTIAGGSNRSRGLSRHGPLTLTSLRPPWTSIPERQRGTGPPKWSGGSLISIFPQIYACYVHLCIWCCDIMLYNYLFHPNLRPGPSLSKDRIRSWIFFGAGARTPLLPNFAIDRRHWQPRKKPLVRIVE